MASAIAAWLTLILDVKEAGLVIKPLSYIPVLCVVFIPFSFVALLLCSILHENTEHSAFWSSLSGLLNGVVVVLLLRNGLYIKSLCNISDVSLGILAFSLGVFASVTLYRIGRYMIRCPVARKG